VDSVRAADARFSPPSSTPAQTYPEIEMLEVAPRTTDISVRRVALAWIRHPAAD
jgi:hypothetical protein